MKRFISILIPVSLGLIALGFHSRAEKKKILFFGDSITQQAVLPDGYISQLRQVIDSSGRGNEFELIGAGISGDKVYDLYLRMEEDVLAKKPSVVVFYVGVNDVWHKRLLGTGTDFQKFGRFYQAIVEKLQAAGIQVVVCTPAVIGERTDFSNELDGDLNLYSTWIRSFATGRKIPVADLRAAFLAYNLQHNTANAEKGILTTDRVHLNKTGNALVAAEVWKAIGKLE